MEVSKSSEIGLKQGQILANLPRHHQLNLIAEGLPILLTSATELTASSKLPIHSRATTILAGMASEECSKILILMDIVRCPRKLVASRTGPMVKLFYNHLARLIYVEAQMWKPADIKMLQEYVDSHCQTHQIEGLYDILPNWAAFSRESVLYADILRNESGDPVWNIPGMSTATFDGDETTVFHLCQALSDFGFFTREGLDIVADVWNEVDFSGCADPYSKLDLTYETIDRLSAKGLISGTAENDQMRLLSNHWQVPMYNIDFKRIKVTLEELQDERDANMAFYL